MIDYKRIITALNTFDPYQNSIGLFSQRDHNVDNVLVKRLISDYRITWTHHDGLITFSNEEDVLHHYPLHLSRYH